MKTYNKIWLHFVWSTKNRERLITNSLKFKLIHHIKEYGEKNDIRVDTINGDMDHIHLLVKMKPIQSPSEIANQLKGEPSNWINKMKFLETDFAWQSGFAVFSVSESFVNKIRQYIKNQEVHNRNVSYLEELDNI